MIIKTKSGEGFRTNQAARIFAGRLHLKEFNIITVPGAEGEKPKYAIDTPEEPEASALESAEKHKVTEPWKPASLLHIPEDLKDPNYTYRFCVNEESRPGNIRKKLAEKWEVDKELLQKMKERNLIHLPTIEDGKPLDSTLTVREMVVMRIPKEIAKARNEYYTKRASDASASAEAEYKGKARSMGIETYEDIKEE